MSKTSVINPTADHNNNIVRWAESLGTAKLRRKLFNEIYGRKSRPRSKNQLTADAGVKNDQLAQNELKHLVRKHLIDRVKNEGEIDDGSKYLYLKDENVSAHKDEIIRNADNKSLRNRKATKERPIVRGATTVVKRMVITRKALAKKKPLDVLYMMSNPTRRNALSLDKEIKAVKEEIKRSRYRDNIVLHQSDAADRDDIVNGLNDHEPRIVHFSGHGDAAGISMDAGTVKRSKKQFVTYDHLAKMLAATATPPDVVVLSACNSAGSAKALLATVKAIIVMQAAISDEAAVAFATRFYGAIASGQPLQVAFDQGCNEVDFYSPDDAAVPSLIVSKGVNPKKLVLI